MIFNDWQGNSYRFLLKVVCWSGLFLFINACVPPIEETSEVVIDYAEDPTQGYIEELVYRQKKDSLYYYLSHPNATYRFLAAKGFSSFTPKDALDTLIAKLKDPVPEVATAASHALGQLGNPKAESALTNAFVKRDSVGLWLQTNHNILEALGKIAGKPVHELIASVTTYLPQDTSLVLGQARALYHFSNRNITSESGLLRAIELLNASKYSEDIRLYAAHYLANSTAELLEKKADTLMDILSKEESINIQLPLIKGISKTGTFESYQFLVKAFDKWTDYRARVATLKNIHYFERYANAAYPFVLQQLAHDNYHVARSAADYFYKYGNAKYARMYWLKAKSSQLHPEVGLDMYRAAFRHMPLWHIVRMASMRYELFTSYIQAESPYTKKQILLAMGENLDNLSFLMDSMMVRAMDNPITQTALATGLASMINNPIIDQFGKKRKQVYIDSIQVGIERMFDADLETGAISVLSNAMKSAYFQSEEWIQKLEEKQGTLDLPRQYEAWQSLDKTLAYLRGESYSQPAKELTRSDMDFKFYDSGKRALVRTTSGTFILELMPEKAPFTVQNFERLVNEDYFSDKSFHRVVSNFVVQTGCHLGDSYGALDYSISSELHSAYYENAGMVGMASAGKHTESAQWFITLCPYPKLNGRYTIFARVVSGLQIVQKLQMGDRINSVELIE